MDNDSHATSTTFSGILSSSGIINSAPYTVGAAIGSYIGQGYTVPTTITTSFHSNPTVKVTGDASFDGDVTIKGVSIAKTLNEINRRLAILVPDPEKLEHFEALKKAYSHYKTLEALCEFPIDDDETT